MNKNYKILISTIIITSGLLYNYEFIPKFFKKKEKEIIMNFN